MFIDIIAVLILGCLGLAILVYGLLMVKKGLSSKNWPVVSGKVVRAEVIRTRNSFDKDDRKKYFRPIIAYRYEIKEKEYESKFIIPNEGTKSYSNMTAAENLLKDYPLDSSVEVRYNPGDHSDACLVAGVSTFSLVLSAAGAALLLISFIGLVSILA